MDLYNVKTRRKELIEDPSELQNAILSGTHSFPVGSEVTVYNPEGEAGNIPAENVAQAIQRGYRVEAPNQRAIRRYVEDNEGIKGSSKVFFGQLGDELALGLPELIYNKTGDPLEVAKKEALKKEHDLANTLGGVSGFVGSLWTGAPLWKAAGKAGEKVSAHLAEKLAVEAGEQVGKQTIKSAAKNIAVKTGGMAAEGATVATPYAITEAALGDPKDAAEVLLAGGLIGAGLGGAFGVGKEFIGLGRRVVDAGLKLAEKKDKDIKEVSRKIANIWTGVPEDRIEHYIKNSERINKSRETVDILDDIFSVIQKRKGSMDELKRLITKKDEELKITYQNAMRDRSQASVPQATADQMALSLEGLKETSLEIVKEAEEQLAMSNKAIPLDFAIKFVKDAQKLFIPRFKNREVLIGPKSKSRANALKSIENDLEKLRVKKPESKYKKELKELSGFEDLVSKDEPLPAKYFRDIISEVRELIQWNPIAADYKGSKLNRAYQKISEGLQNGLKDISPGYAEGMERAHQIAKLHEKMSDKGFGDRTRGAAVLERMAKGKNKTDEELIRAYDKLVGSNFFGDFQNIKAAKADLEAAARGDIREKIVPGLSKEVKDLRERLIQEEINFRPLQPLSTEKKIESVMKNLDAKRPSIPNVRAIQALDKQTSKNFEREIIDRNTLDMFQKENSKSSRLVNLSTLVASGIGAGVGLSAAGPFGLIFGSIAGGAADIYGGRALKVFLDKYENKAGLLFVEKKLRNVANRVDETPSRIQMLSRGFQTLGKEFKARQGSPISIDAIFRMMGKEAPKNYDREEIADELTKLTERLGSYVYDPGSYNSLIGEYMTALTEGGAPNIAGQLSLGAKLALGYLYNEIPKAPKPTSPFSPKTSWLPSDKAINDFAQKLEVTEDPTIVLDKMVEGTLTDNHMQALKSVYPYIFSQIQKRIFDYASSGEATPLNYQQRLMVSLLSEMPIDSSLEDIDVYQRVFKMQSQQMMNEQRSPSVRKPIRINEMNQSRMQQILSK